MHSSQAKGHKGQGPKKIDLHKIPGFPDTHLPAVLVGGPPHSGKSVLVYDLTTALQRAGIAHYVLRACPDGEGNWYLAGNQEQVKVFRYKGKFSARFLKLIVKLIHNRQVPLLVDMGGRPTREQEAIAAACTHALLLIRDDAQPTETKNWKALTEKYSLSRVAHLRSVPAQSDRVRSQDSS